MIKRPRASQVLRKLTLQGRFALFAALAVSVAVVAAAVISYFLVSGQLNRQIDQQLTAQTNAAPGGPGLSGRLPSVSSSATGTTSGSGNGPGGHQPTASTQYSNCTHPATNSAKDLGDPAFAGIGGLTIAKSDGWVCTLNASFSLGETATATQIAVAKGEENNQLYDTYTTGGTHVRAYTYYANETGYSYTRVIDVSHVDTSLHQPRDRAFLRRARRGDSRGRSGIPRRAQCAQARPPAHQGRRVRRRDRRPVGPAPCGRRRRAQPTRAARSTA